MRPGDYTEPHQSSRENLRNDLGGFGSSIYCEPITGPEDAKFPRNALHAHMMISTVGNHHGLPGTRTLAAASLLPPPPLPPYRVLCWPYRPAQKQGAVLPSKLVTLSLVLRTIVSN